MEQCAAIAAQLEPIAADISWVPLWLFLILLVLWLKD